MEVKIVSTSEPYLLTTHEIYAQSGLLGQYLYGNTVAELTNDW